MSVLSPFTLKPLVGNVLTGYNGPIKDGSVLQRVRDKDMSHNFDSKFIVWPIPWKRVQSQSS